MSGYNRHAEEDDQARTLMGLLLHRARMHRRMTRAQVARKAGMTVARLREIEKGFGASGRLDDLDRISRALAMVVRLAAIPEEMVSSPATPPAAGGET